MTAFFTRERFGRPQFIAAILLLIFLFQCLWLGHRLLGREAYLGQLDQRRIKEGLRQWHGKGIAGTPHLSAPTNSDGSLFQNESYDVNRSPLWYLIASAPLLVWRAPLSVDTHSYWGWLARLPYLMFGLLLGASLWYVSRRLFGNAGGYIALALYCFSPAAIITTAVGTYVEPEIGAVWGVFGAVFTAIAVAHTLYAPREVVLWNWRRIVLLALSLVLAVGSQFSLVIVFPLTLGFMLWVASARRGAAFTIWIAASVSALLLWWAAYSFHAAVMWQSFRHANFVDLPGQAFLTLGLYKQLAATLAKNSPPLMLALPAAFITYLAWPRTRYFGNSAPLLVAFLSLALAIAAPHSPVAGFQLIATIFLFVFVSGVFADLLETRYRVLVSTAVWGLLVASGLRNLLQLTQL